MTPKGPPSQTVHRPEIDGLRSIAVLAVVFYHFGVPGLSGGFVGVDVFFVISGFLIGGLLWREHKNTGRLSLGRFFLRRIRRLAPAYFIMAFVALIVTSFVLLPFEYREFGKGLIAATVYLSNVLFFRQSGYFDTSSDEKILLHTWSLSVEEQFYIFLPLVFLLFASKPTRLSGVLVVLALASLVGSIVLTPISQTATFYLFPFRAWELLSGVLLAIIGIERNFQWKLGWIWSWLGLVLILGAVCLITPTQDFPGWQVIVPVAGTLLLIAGGQQDNLVNRLLSSRAPVFVGLISYSLYLWHWPVLTLSKYVRGSYASAFETSLWMLLAFVLAILSWRFVEQPIRQAQRLPALYLVSVTCITSIVLLLSGAAIFKNDGFVGRFAPSVQQHIAASADFLQDFSRCNVPASGDFSGFEVCPIGPLNQEPTILIWGDSHVRAFYEGLVQAANTHNRSALVVWQAGCPPVFDLDKIENSATQSQNSACRVANDQIRAAIAASDSLQTILLIGRWSYYATGIGTGRDISNEIILTTPLTEISDRPQSDIFLAAFERTIHTFIDTSKVVSVLRQPPAIAAYDSRRVAQALAYGTMTTEQATNAATIVKTTAVSRSYSVDAALARLQRQGLIQLLDPWPQLCDDVSCHALINGVGQYFDNNHVTNSAARRLAPLFDPIFTSNLQSVSYD